MITPLDALAEPSALETPVSPELQKPDGWVKDKETGQYRPPKRRGRKPAPTAPPTDHDPIDRSEPDTEPDAKTRGKNQRGVPRWKAGVIAKGMAKFYRRTGRIIKAMDHDIGVAFIESADDCGEAWDEIARTNPRIRAFLLKMITGGSWAGLVWAHAPIFMAIAMKDAIRKHIPFMRFISSMLEPDESGESEISDMLGGINSDDVATMANAMMAGPMGQMVAGMMARSRVEAETEDD